MFENKLGGLLYATAIGIYRDIMPIMPEQDNWLHRDQCVKALGSMVANIAEGSGKHKPDGKYYQNALQHSRGSAFEVIAWLQMGVIDGVFTEPDIINFGNQILVLGDSLYQEIMH